MTILKNHINFTADWPTDQVSDWLFRHKNDAKWKNCDCCLTAESNCNFYLNVALCSGIWCLFLIDQKVQKKYGNYDYRTSWHFCWLVTSLPIYLKIWELRINQKLAKNLETSVTQTSNNSTPKICSMIVVKCNFLHITLQIHISEYFSFQLFATDFTRF